MKYEDKFFEALGRLFVGKKVEGKSGFINLMHIKQSYYDEHIQTKIREKINERIPDNGTSGNKDGQREELFDKLYNFFSRYFCESGSVYFRYLQAGERIYDRVYEEDRDVELVWKTRDLYYVKSDFLIRNIRITDPDNKWTHYHFDATEFENKQNNERRDFVFEYQKTEKEKNDEICHYLSVSYKHGNKSTNIKNIIRSLKEAGTEIQEEQLQLIFNTFKRQTEADYFIHKNARKFLREQFDLYMYQYIWNTGKEFNDAENDFSQKRLKQLNTIQQTAYDIIDFISQFEDELVRIWQKPKFVRNLNYVITLDRIQSVDLLEKLSKHPGMQEQITEWQQLGLTDENFSFQPPATDQKRKSKQVHLPLDTKYFKDLELELLNQLGNLTEALDGELVHSENYQALNTLKQKYKERIQCIYIDPPFNLDGSDQFDYRTNYKDACWATMLENRLELARDFLSDTGCIFVRCDYNGNWIVRSVIKQIFDVFLNEIIVNRTQEFFKSPTPKQKKLMNDIDSLLLAGKSSKARINRIQVERSDDIWYEPFLPNRNKDNNKEYRIIEGKKMWNPNNRLWGLSQKEVDEAYAEKRIKVKNEKIKYKPKYKNIKNNWTDIKGYERHWGFPTENAEVLLKRVIQSTETVQEKIFFDFFAGCGTTPAVAQKLNRKWLGVEMGNHFYTFYRDKAGEEKVGAVGRMKKVLGGYQSSISKEKDVDYQGGGAFKYYALEQYEDTLRKMHYKDSSPIYNNAKLSDFQQYVFLADAKFTFPVAADRKPNRLSINLYDIYADLDIGESLANILGKQIKERTADTVIFADGEKRKINPAVMTEEEKVDFLTAMRPYLWWGEA